MTWSARLCGLIALAGCGRLGFDAAADAAAVDSARTDAPGTDGSGPRADVPDIVPPVCHEGAFGPLRTLDELTDASGEIFEPTLTADELLIVFTSSRFGSDGFDLWYAERGRRQDPFDPPERLVDVSTKDFEGEPSLSPDGLTLWFVRRWKADDQVFVVRRSSRIDPFVADVPEQIPARDDVGMAIFDGGRAALWSDYFAPLDEGSLRLTTRAFTSDAFGPDEVVDVRTNLRETYPMLTDDRLELFYEAGDADDVIQGVYRTVRGSPTDPFSPPIQILDRPHGDPFLTADGRRLYVAVGVDNLAVTDRACP